MKPTIGRIVIYRATANDADTINRRREDAQEKMLWHQALKTGTQVHVGNSVKEGDEFPLIITRVWGDSESAAFNGQLLLDGNDLYWVTSTKIGDKPRECYWPNVKAANEAVPTDPLVTAKA